MILQGQKILLRDFERDDLPILRHWLLPGHSWQEYDGPYYPLLSPEEITAHIEKIAVRIDESNWANPRQRLVIADEETGELLGQVSRYWISQETDWIAIGIVIYSPEHWGSGRGYEALGLWSDYLFQEMPQIVRLDLRTWSGNQGMMRLAEKLGYQLEARFRRARIVKGQYYDGLGYGVLREEWQGRFAGGFAQSRGSR